MSMIIDRIVNRTLELKPDDREVMLISLIPVINNIFFQIKYEQLYETKPKNLEKFGRILRIGLYSQIFLYARVHARLMEPLFFWKRMKRFTYLTTYYVLADIQITELRDAH